MVRKWTWGYVDARNVAQAVARALRPNLSGAEVAIIAAAHLHAPTERGSPRRGVPNGDPRPDQGRQTLLSIEHARSMLGYEPAFSWTDPAAAID